MGAQGDENVQGCGGGADLGMNGLEEGSDRRGAGVIRDDEEDSLSAVLGSRAELGDQGGDLGGRDGLVIRGDSGINGNRAHGEGGTIPCKGMRLRIVREVAQSLRRFRKGIAAGTRYRRCSLGAAAGREMSLPRGS